MILFMLNQPNLTRLQECLATMSDDDALLLLQDGVTFASNKDALKEIQSRKVFLLKHDCKARALIPLIPKTMSLIDDKEFVELTLTYNQIIRWN